MAYVSFGLDRGADQSPDRITIGTDDGGAGNNVTVAVNKGVGFTHEEVILVLQAIIRRLEDGRNTDLANV
jgi:hypothetical protein